MRLRKKHNNVEPESKSALTNKAALLISSTLLRTQHLFAIMMNRVFGKLGNSKSKFLLWVFCLTSGGYSVFLMLSFMSKSNEQASFLKTETVERPRYFDNAGDPIEERRALYSDYDVKRLEDFIKSVDSLKLNNTRTYDSIIKARPGLVDSCKRLIEMINSQQLKNKDDE